MRRVFRQGLALVCLGAASFLTTAQVVADGGISSASADRRAAEDAVTPAVAATHFVALINETRVAAGLDPLRIEAHLVAAAADWTDAMVGDAVLAHAPDLAAGAPPGWRKIGENVGRGPTVDDLYRAFLESPGHRANIVDPAYDVVGVVVATGRDGRLYTTHRFADLG